MGAHDKEFAERRSILWSYDPHNFVFLKGKLERPACD